MNKKVLDLYDALVGTIKNLKLVFEEVLIDLKVGNIIDTKGLQDMVDRLDWILCEYEKKRELIFKSEK